MLTCHDVSAMMSGINLVQIQIILMNAAKTDRPYFDIRSLIRPTHRPVSRYQQSVFDDSNI